ncbi:MAG: Na/Pi cotransporter family protein [Xanthomonadales bacterium]|nr:Na/Pi cotransporter family protein [Xanthomonadales bacterium]NIN58820.1 Na/Pi cotransporter family protein [Xanthomonadales bacterium]NIN74088.1 Na/Pi cotransporter family protein [Xanthomonadales bacterium]NIO14621.1 Na/Pi cotransporter family protein [Xanthomonadales bacterium]NIP11213.1 Na/Pi cotransporter family protein [Xanthomonadales bacterium]
MTSQLLTALGGLGLFLIGMVIMTDGLKAMAGDALHAWLTRFTHSPATGALTGTVATAVLQSSSATTVTTVGFVAAGLLTFPQALGIVFGANLGTTVTGWMVAVFGFKLKVGAAALPVVFAGAVLRIFGRGNWQHAGRVLAGFGVIFLGLDFLQQGMGAFRGVVTPDSFPADSFLGRLLLVGLGIVITLVTQSSSAGVAIAMTALSLGAISFPQAAAMVIGMDVGTTITAVLASIGSSEAARRTGLSHTIFNLFTAVGALVLLGPYVWLLGQLAPTTIGDNPELALVGFHTLFNFASLAAGVPLASPFARLMERLVPARQSSLAYRLDKRLLQEPVAAAAALEATLADAFDYLLEWVGRALIDRGPPEGIPVGVVLQDLGDARDYLDQLNAAGERGRYQPRVGVAIHALDHLRRLYHRLEQRDRVTALGRDKALKPQVIEFRTLCAEIQSRPGGRIGEDTYRRAGEFARRLQDSTAAFRSQAIAEAVAQDLSIAETNQRMAGARWLARVAHHVWRVAAHLGGYDVREEAGVELGAD